MVANAAALATEEDRDYLLPTLDVALRQFRPGRYVRVTILTVDSTNKIFTASAPGGVTIVGSFGDLAPGVSEAGWCLKMPEGAWLYDDLAIST